MSDDINKKIKIEAELDTAKLTKNVTELTKAIDSLTARQQQLSLAGLQNSSVFDNLSAKLETLKNKLQDVTTQLNSNTTAINGLSNAAKTLDSALSSSTQQYQKNTSAAAAGEAKTKALGSEVKNLDQAVKQHSGTLGQNTTSVQSYQSSIVNVTGNVQKLTGGVGKVSAAMAEQGEVVSGNKDKFDAHKAVMEHLKTSFDEIKGVSGEFGPSLEQAAKGFDVMKTGLKLVQEGFTGVGTALKADGFDFLLQILQMIFDWFIKTSTGSSVLKGAISAIGVVVNEVSSFFHTLLDGIVNAFSHPVESIKALGKMIVENIINRFKAFSVILDGIIHLDFKKMADGAIQAFTGVTHATDKIVQGAKMVAEGVTNTAGKMVTAFKAGYKEAGKAVDEHNKKVTKANDHQIAHYKKVQKAAKDAYGTEKAENCKCEAETSGTQLTGSSGTVVINTTGIVNAGDLTTNNLGTTSDKNNKTTGKEEDGKKPEDTTLKVKQDALKKIEEYAAKSAKNIETEAFKILTDSIKKQADAKIAALEKDKAAELSNKSLTSAQRLAIENKYKKQEAAVKVKAFKDEQKMSIAQAIVNGALAMTKTAANTGFPLTFAFEPAVLAQTAAEIAKIASQKPPAMAKGGHFKSDGKGAVLPGYSRHDDTNAYLRSGEAVVVSEAMQVPWARNLVSAINVGFGGRDFSVTNPGRGYVIGGIFTDGGNANRYYNQPITDQKNLANTLAYQMINNFPPVYVDVKDINNQQNILAQTINRVNL